MSRVCFIIGVIILWQIVYLTGVFPAITFPSVSSIFYALITSFTKESMIQIIGYSMSLVLKGLLFGIVLAFILSILSILSKEIYKIYTMIIAIMDPLPGIALLPLAILWFGTGEATIIFIIIHSVIWPLSRNIIDGFNAVPQLYIETGKNIGLKGIRLITGVYLPSSFPYILSGLKVGWARAWRALISAEMIFGVSGSIGGLGWYIYKKRYQLETDGVFASLIVIIIIGIIIEYGIFSQIEKRTVKKWGMVK